MITSSLVLGFSIIKAETYDFNVYKENELLYLRRVIIIIIRILPFSNIYYGLTNLTFLNYIALYAYKNHNKISTKITLPPKFKLFLLPN